MEMGRPRGERGGVSIFVLVICNYFKAWEFL